MPALAAACLLAGALIGAGVGLPGSSDPPSSQGGTAGGAAAPPNIVVVMTDDQRADDLAAMPKVRRLLGRRGTEFRQAITTTPQCCPSRAGYLTGRYAHNHGVLGNRSPVGGYGKLRGRRTLPVWLRAAGYRTAHIGRYLNEYGNGNLGEDPREVPPGWQRWVAPVNHTEFRMYGYTLNVDGELVEHGTDAEDYMTDVLADMAVEEVAAASRDPRPFFIDVATTAPHKEGAIEADARRNPRPAPRHEGRFEDEPLPRSAAFNPADTRGKGRRVRESARFDDAGVAELERLHRSRLESLLAVDDLVGRLVRALRRANELERTVFVFTSDQGFMLGEHRQRGKSDIYESALRVPLLVRGPGFEAGATAVEQVALHDLSATIVSLAGAEPGFVLDGLSLTAEGGPERRARPGLAIEHFVRTRFRGVRTPAHLYAEVVPGEVELYDLRRDPDQMRNLAGRPRHDGLERRLAALTVLLANCEGRSCEPSTAELDTALGDGNGTAGAG